MTPSAPRRTTTLPLLRGLRPHWPLARLAAALGAAAAVAACSILPAQTPVDTYVLPGKPWLGATTASASRADGFGPSLRITRPAANGMLGSKRIIVMPQADRLQVYQGAVWNEAPPHMLRNRLLDAFLAHGHLSSVDTDEGPTIQVDYLLATQLRDFHSVYENGSPTAIIRMDAQIVHTGSNRAIASRSFVVKQPATSKEVPAVVQALGQAADQLAQDMVAWAAPYLRPENTARKNTGR